MPFEHKKIAERIIGIQGRIISMRKSTGPSGAVYNAMVFNEMGVKIWAGDLDMESDQEKLIRASGEIRSSLYVIEESEGIRLKRPATRGYLYQVAVAIVERNRILINGRIILKMKSRARIEKKEHK